MDIKTIFRKVKRCGYTPRVLVGYASTDCTYKILITGVDAVVIVAPDTIGGAVDPITPHILKSGKQKVKVIMFNHFFVKDSTGKYLKQFAEAEY